FDDYFVLVGEIAAEALQPRAGHVDPSCRTEPAILPDHHLCKRAMDVHADYASHCAAPLSCASTGAVGNTTPTDPRSRRNRAGRGGGQLLTRALGSFCK